MTKKKTDDKVITWLLAHCDERGKNTAQTQVAAPTQRKAEAYFKGLYPDREITATGIKGDEG